MKAFTLACFLTLASFAVHAGTITLNDTMCLNTAMCSQPAPGVDWIQYSAQYGSVSVSLGGKIYSSGAIGVAQPFISVLMTATDGSTAHVSAAFVLRSIVSGRTRLTRYELVSGAITY